MHEHARLGCLLLLTVLPRAAALGQQSPPPTQPANGKITLDVVVTPKTGAADIGLQQPDFTLLDNDTAQTITSFKPATAREAPPEVVVLIDAVNAAYQAVMYEHSELDKYFRAEGGHLGLPMAIGVLTDSGLQILGDFSSDGAALSAQLNQNNSGLRAFRAYSGLAAAAERWQISLTALRRLAAAEALRPGLKLLMWISPGWPLCTGASGELSSKQQQQVFGDIVSLSNLLARARITLYQIDPIGAGESLVRTDDYKPFLKPVTKPGQAFLDNLSLQVLTIQSGGLVFQSDNDITKILHTCLADATP
jgi:VWFA-related protein